MNFESIFLGQSVLKYQVPLEVFVGLNELYETQKKHLPNANKQLAGKIPDEVSLFYDGKDTSKMHRHSFVSEDILKWFLSVFKHYLDWNKTSESQMNINSIWVNEMKAGDYNPVHVHRGTIFTGLSSVMILKLPKDYGPEPHHQGSSHSFLYFSHAMTNNTIKENRLALHKLRRFITFTHKF